MPFRAFCVEGPQNLMFVRPCVCCPSVTLSRSSPLWSARAKKLSRKREKTFLKSENDETVEKSREKWFSPGQFRLLLIIVIWCRIKFIGSCTQKALKGHLALLVIPSVGVVRPQCAYLDHHCRWSSQHTFDSSVFCDRRNLKWNTMLNAIDRNVKRLEIQGMRRNIDRTVGEETTWQQCLF